MKALITGGFGFIGKNFTNLYSHKFEHIINLDKMSEQSSTKGCNPKCTSIFIKRDLRELTAEFLKPFDFDYVVHFASESHVDRSINDPNGFMESNVMGTQKLFEALRGRKNLKKVILISTDEVFGSTKEGFFTEASIYNPSSPYSASKACQDMIATAYRKTYNLPIVSINCTNNFGPLQDLEKFIPKAISCLLEETKIPVYGDGENVRDWIYVNDFCEIIFKILDSRNNHNHYLVGGDCLLSNNQILYDLTGLMGKSYEKCFEFVEDRKAHDFRYAVDCSRVKDEYSWTPSNNFRANLSETINSYL
tara:strand:- start:23801 stop:24718 length:918 start_codon:yes stop_codon:yes gene_type:complete